MSFSTEIQTKLARLRALMSQHQVDTVWLQRVENFSWLTGGIDVAVNTAGATGVASLVVTADRATVWTNTIEAPRLETEDHIRELGFDLHVTPWEETAAPPTGQKLATDTAAPGTVDLTGDLSQLRARLLPVEQQRFHQLGAGCARAMEAAIRRVRPGQTESELAGILSEETRRQHITPIVTLIGTDERIYRYRHPMATEKVLDKYAMLVLCGRRWGLVCSVTRLVHFGPLPADLHRRIEATAEVDAAMIAASVPGATLEDVFRVAQAAYARVGFADEWKLHHQGGLAGYIPREALGVPGATLTLEPGMACAWNPSITGAKCEDTVLVPPPGGAFDILTTIPAWPVRRVQVGSTTLERPLILEIT